MRETSAEVRREGDLKREAIRKKIKKSGKYRDYGTAKQIWTGLVHFLCSIIRSEYETVACWQHIF